MNYNSIYEKLIQRAIGRKLTTYTESHHIIPKCLNGTNDSSNLVDLTPEEHYLAHQLLVKMYPDNISLIYAAKMMTISSPKSDRSKNKLFGWLRRKNLEVQKTKEFTPETRKRMSESAKRKPKVKCPHCGKEGLEGNMKRWHFDNCPKGPTPKIVTLSKEEKEHISLKLRSIEWKQHTCIHCGLTGKACNIIPHEKCCKQNPNRIKQRTTVIECPHCQKTGSPSNMKRWHFDNCKNKPR